MSDVEPDVDGINIDDEPDFDGIKIDIQPDGTVHLHAHCKPGEDSSTCAERLQFLIDALGIPIEGVITKVTE